MLPLGGFSIIIIIIIIVIIAVIVIIILTIIIGMILGNYILHGLRHLRTKKSK